MNRFVKSVAVLVSGTAMAQAIGYLVAPLITRVYNAEELGDLGVYMRAVGFLAAVSTLRYELSLPLPKRDDHSFLLYRLALRIALYVLASVAVAAGVAVVFFPRSWNTLLFLGITLLSALFLVITNLGTNWAIRTGSYSQISFSKVVYAGSSNLLRLAFGWLGLGVTGLLVASLIGYIAGALRFGLGFLKLRRGFSDISSLRKTYALGLEHRDFPMINLPHTVVDLGRDLAIALIISWVFTKEVFGYYSHAYAMLRLPVALIGASIGQVLYNRATEVLHKKGNVRRLIVRATVALFAMSIPVFVLVYAFGIPVFRFVFGEEWWQAGAYAEHMALWLLFSFVSSSLSMLPIVLKRQRAFFLLSLVGTAMQFIGFGLLPILWPTLFDSFENVLTVVSLSQSVFLLVVVVQIIRFAKMATFEKR